MKVMPTNTYQSKETLGILRIHLKTAGFDCYRNEKEPKFWCLYVYKETMDRAS